MIALVLGGTRSGKSEVAEGLASDLAAGAVVTCVVTLRLTGAPDMEARVEAHRARRPSHWRTVEAVDLAAALRATDGVALVDSIGTWVAGSDQVDVDDLVDALVDRTAATVMVSDEVGLGVHPVSAEGREFRDRLGEVNRRVAGVSDRVLLVVAGRVLELPRA